MADYFPGTIHIGGPVPRTEAEELSEQLRAYFPWFTSIAPDDWVAKLNNMEIPPRDDKGLRFMDPEARFGQFEELEAWLEEHAIAYDRFSDARYEYDGEAVFFRPGHQPPKVTFGATQDGNAYVLREDLLALYDTLRDGVDIEESIRRLGELLDPELPELEPFRVVD